MKLDGLAATETQSVSNLEVGSTRPQSGEMGNKTRSAPGSIAGDRQKWVSSRSNALKEIQIWATNGRENESSDNARHSGQLMDNVTEQRMLHSKLWDLSKERHKFLTQNAYEKKIFLDRQQRKSTALREMLDGLSADGRRISWGEEALKRRANIENEGVESARVVFLNRVDPRKRRDRPRDTLSKDMESRHSSCPTPSEAGRRTHFSLPQVVPSVVSQDSHIPGKNPRDKTAGVVFSTEPKPVNKQYRTERPKTSYDRMINTELQVADHPPTTVRFADFDAHDGGLTESMARNPAISKTWSTTSRLTQKTPCHSARSRSTLGDGTCMSPALDSRYVMLKESLSGNYFRNGSNVDVMRIINRLEALHKPSKRGKDIKPRMGQKIKEFIKERGLQI